MLLKDKTAVITGSNRGIGKEILETFSSNGANIFACSRQTDDKFIELIESYKKKYNNQIYPIKLDLDDQEDVKEASKKILSQNLNIDILVNNAGAITTSLFQMTPEKKLKEIFNTNFFAQTTFTQYILKSMIKKKKGSVLYISSSSALDGNLGRSAYAASKSAIIAQSKVLSRELGSLNIRVNTLAPGLTNTDMMRNNTPEKDLNEAVNSTSLKRVAHPKEIADVALFICSDLSSYITGQVIRVDGGM